LQPGLVIWAVFVSNIFKEFLLPMPFSSEKQMRYMYSQNPEIAKRWSKEAKAAGKPQIQKGGKMKKGYKTK
jgi:hypothetical protein